MSDSPLSLSDLKPKMKLTGTVTKIELFGAFLDVGVGRDGLLHISQLKAGHVNNVQDVLEEGQEITVWVRQVDHGTGRLDLTMIEPPEVAWEELAAGQVYSGTVVRVEKFGVFVDIGAERPGLVHISELTTGFVNSPSDVVQKGDVVEVKVIGVNRRKNQIDLSMKALGSSTAIQQEEADEELPTAMALALQRAMTGSEGETRSEQSRRGKASRDARREELNQLLRRTLDQHKGE